MLCALLLVDVLCYMRAVYEPSMCTAASIMQHTSSCYSIVSDTGFCPDLLYISLDEDALYYGQC